MFDAQLRQRLDQPLDSVARTMSDRGIRPNAVTGLGFAVGLAGSVAVVTGHWWIALALWLLNRTLDGLDGSIARRVGPTQLGGFLDIMADFAIYGSMVVAIGWAVPDARLAALFVFFSYYVNGAAFLAWSSLVAEKIISAAGTDHAEDERSLHFPAGLAEGGETVFAMALILAFRPFATPLMWIWAGVVTISAAQRIYMILTRLRSAA